MLISKEQARAFLIQHHMLNQPPNGTDRKSQIITFMKRAGCIQFDPLDVVSRNAELVLQARIPGFQRNDLYELLYKDRLLLDGWDKERSIHLTEEWPQYTRVREANAQSRIWIINSRGQSSCMEHIDQVIEAISQNGPLMPKDIDLGSCNGGAWGHGKVAGVLMDYLFEAGKIGVHHKERSLRSYDLIDRLLDPALLKTSDPFKNHHEFLLWYFKRRITAVGLIWSKSGGAWNGHYLSDRKQRIQILNELEEQGEIFSLTVEGLKHPLYISKENLPQLTLPVTYDQKARILAPLDNLLWDRDLIKTLFDFEYTWEVYLPAAKRKYGYYVLPILYKDQLIARFEPAHHKPGIPLTIKNWWWNPNTPTPELIIPTLQTTFTQFAAYLQAPTIISPPQIPLLPSYNSPI